MYAAKTINHVLTWQTLLNVTQRYSAILTEDRSKTGQKRRWSRSLPRSLCLPALNSAALPNVGSSNVAIRLRESASGHPAANGALAYVQQCRNVLDREPITT
jgi:hypothetical protein